MKKIMKVLTIGAAVAMLALPVAAKNVITVTDDAVQDACTDAAKAENYTVFRNTLKTDQAKAYEAAKKYLGCPAPATPTESDTKIIEYLTRFTKAYEDVKRKSDLTDTLYNKKNVEAAFKLGREILATEPDYVKGLIDLGANGYLVAPLKNEQLTAEAIQYARKALGLLDGGKTVEDWGPLLNKDVATAYLNYTIGSLTVEKDPSGALKHLIKSAQFETPLKKSAVTYALIAGAYETGEYAKRSAEYKEKYFDKEETPESKLALANINQLVDRMIDGYARAVALAGTDSKLTAQKDDWNANLTNLYKFRNNKSDAGLAELIAGILAKPLPPEPTPLTVLPAAPASTPAGTSGGATPTNGTGNGTGNGAGNGAAAAPAKPAATPATANTKPVNDKPNKPRQ